MLNSFKNTIFIAFIVLLISFVDINFLGTKTKDYKLNFNNKTYTFSYPFLYNYLDFSSSLNFNNIVGIEYVPIEVKIWNVSGPFKDDICLLNRDGDWKISFNYIPLKYNCVQTFEKCGSYFELAKICESLYNKSIVQAYYRKGFDPCDIYFEKPGIKDYLYLR